MRGLLPRLARGPQPQKGSLAAPPFQLQVSRSACLGDGLEGLQIAGPLRRVIFTNARNPALCHRPRQLEQLRDLARERRGVTTICRRGQGTAPAGPSARACSHPRSPPYPGHGQRAERQRGKDREQRALFCRFEVRRPRASWPAEAFILGSLVLVPAASLQMHKKKEKEARVDRGSSLGLRGRAPSLTRTAPPVELQRLT